MKKYIALTLAVAAAAVTSPAMAQSAVTGTVDITGNVPGKCQVLTGGGGISQTFGNSAVDLGDLSAADGTLRTGITVSSTNFAGLDARVVCTSAQADVTLTASPLAISGAAPALAGYANVIDYTAAAQLTTTSGTTPLSVDTATQTSSSATIDRLANNGGNNIAITADLFETAAGAILEQGSYAATITLSIVPAA